MGKLSSKSKWAWKAHFLSHNPEILENWITFRDVQMLLLSFFEIPYVEKLAKNVQKQYVQVIPRSTNRVNELNSKIVVIVKPRLASCFLIIKSATSTSDKDRNCNSPCIQNEILSGIR